MFNDDDDRKKMALSLVHYVYRNTKVEDYHSEGVVLNKEYYKKVYKIVNDKLKNAFLLNKYIDAYSEKIESKQDFEKLLKTVPQHLQFKFLNYFSEILFGMHFGLNWDCPNLIDIDLNGKSVAHYILAGNFTECCEKGVMLDDKTMCYINKDIHNRIYSLLLNGYFS